MLESPLSAVTAVTALADMYRGHGDTRSLGATRSNLIENLRRVWRTLQKVVRDSVSSCKLRCQPKSQILSLTVPCKLKPEALEPRTQIVWRSKTARRGAQVQASITGQGISAATALSRAQTGMMTVALEETWGPRI